MARILIVDDDRDVVDACRLFLERSGHVVTAAHDRESGLREVAESPPDLLVLDVMMDEPDDGIVMARQLRHDGFTAPIVMLTGLAKVTGLPYGPDPDVLPVDVFLDKPVRPSVLVEAVSGLLARAAGTAG